jgi:uncharacterized protein YkwD
VDGDDRDDGKRAAAAPARRIRLLLSCVAAVAVLAGGGLYLARGVFSAGTAAGEATVDSRTTAAGCGALASGSCLASPAGVTVVVPPAVVTVPPRRATARAHPAGTGSSPAASPSRSPSLRATAPPTGTGSTQASASASSPAGGTGGDQGGAPAAQVLALINQARSAAGLPALTETAGLDASAAAHNTTMANGCGLSHQCPGEPALGDRETAAGVHWTAAGENIGEGGPVADSTTGIAQMAVGLTQSMLDEQPPDDGHRLNILSSTFTHIGIAVERDGAGTVWLTQDFSN